MNKLYFAYIKDEAEKTVKMTIKKTEQEARDFLNQYKQREGACCILNYKLYSQDQSGSHRLADYYA